MDDLIRELGVTGRNISYGCNIFGSVLFPIYVGYAYGKNHTPPDPRTIVTASLLFSTPTAFTDAQVRIRNEAICDWYQRPDIALRALAIALGSPAVAVACHYAGHLIGSMHSAVQG